MYHIKDTPETQGKKLTDDKRRKQMTPKSAWTNEKNLLSMQMQDKHLELMAGIRTFYPKRNNQPLHIHPCTGNQIHKI